MTSSGGLPTSRHSSTSGARPVGWNRTCSTALPKDWQQALVDDTIPHGRGRQSIVEFIDKDGDALIEDEAIGLNGHNELRWVNQDGGSILIDDFASHGGQAWQVLGASFDGRYLAYSVIYSPHNLNGWGLYLWDSEQGRAPKLIAHSDVTNGGPPRGPLVYPVAINGYVFWPQVKAAADGHSRLFRYQVSNGKTRKVHTATEPVWLWKFGGSLMWAGGYHPNELTRLFALDPATLAQRRLPKIPRQIRGPSSLATNGHYFAWTTANRGTLWLWHTGWTQPVKLVSTKMGLPLGHVSLTADFVTWTNQTAFWVLDLRTGGYAKLTPEYGNAVGNGKDWLTISFAPTKKGRTGSRAVLINTSKLSPIPGCA